MTAPPETVALVETRPDSDHGTTALRGYTDELLGRWHGRPPTAGEIDAFLAESPKDGLVPPDGVFLVAFDHDETVVGCLGLRLRGPGVPDDAGEIKRMWTSPTMRGRGLGKRLLADAVRRAREAGCARLVLDSRADLVEARTLYERAGFVETESYNENPHAQVWYTLDLR